MPRFNDEELDAFVVEFRALMKRDGRDPARLKVAPDRSRFRLRQPDGKWFVILAAHLGTGTGTPIEMARAVYDVFLEDIGVKPLPSS